MPKYLAVEFSDGSVVGIPVDVIARHRAKSYADEFNGDAVKSLAEDTQPLFDADPYEVQDWAFDNMDWSDVKDHAVLLKPATPVNRTAEWATRPSAEVEEHEGGEPLA